MKKKILKSKGILFWITGLSGSGKSTIAKKIKSRIIKKYGPTIVINGDNLRKIFKLFKYSKKERLKNGLNFGNFCKFLTDQKLNVIFAVVGMFDKIRNNNKNKIKNYIEIYIKSDLKKIIKAGKKNLYKQKNIKNLIGKDIKPEFPKKPHIVVTNNFKKDLNELSNLLLNKIDKIIV